MNWLRTSPRTRLVTTVAILGGLVLASQVSPATASDTNENIDGVTIDSAAQTVTVDSADVGIQLPGESVTDSVNLSQVPADLFNGTSAALVSTQEGDSLISSYATDEGLQTLIEIPNADAPTEYRFPLDLPEGGDAVLWDDGSVLILDANGDPAGGFRAPWAVDANGKDLPTSFRIEDGSLVQTVEFNKDTAFPVVADPDFGTEWWGFYLQLTKAETRNIASANGNVSSIAGIVSGACALITATIGSAACAVIINGAAFGWTSQFSSAKSSGKCVAINVPWAGLGMASITVIPVGTNVTVVNCRR